METGNIGGSIEPKKSYKKYGPEEKIAFLTKVEEYKEAKIPEEQWDPKIREFSEAYDDYLDSDEDNFNSSNKANPGNPWEK
jgi:hypothetical protein